MIVFNQTIFNIYTAELSTTAQNYKTYAKTKCVDAYLPKEVNTYTQLVGNLTTKLLNIGGVLWLESELEEVMGNDEGALIKMPKEPVGEDIYEQVKGQVVRYLRNTSIEYAFWLLQDQKIHESYISIITTDDDSHLKQAFIMQVPKLVRDDDGLPDYLPAWFVDKVRNYVHHINKDDIVAIYLGHEPDITQESSIKRYPIWPEPKKGDD